MDFYQQKIYDRIARFVPENAVQMAYELWLENPFRFVISNARQTKLGDFRAKHGEALAVITVNNNLNPYAFLLTFVHEVAHHRVHQQFKGRTTPHGLAWKQAFRQLMEPFLQQTIFPPELNMLLHRHMRNPKASSQSDIKLAAALAAYDEQPKTGIPLIQLKIGATFELEKKAFQSLESRRTRVRCKELTTGKYYLVHKLALVIPCKN